MGVVPVFRQMYDLTVLKETYKGVGNENNGDTGQSANER